MFTGIIESLGKIHQIEQENTNLHLWIGCDFTHELKIDQSVAHNGICLTVVEIKDNLYKVTAIEETRNKTSINQWKVGDVVNLERGLKLGDRLDGHLVQGHVDQVGKCIHISNHEGSWKYTFQHGTSAGNTTIEKGSITVNGVSLTVVDSKINEFSVAIIPYTYEHTTFQYLKVGDTVNLEFDVFGKYVAKLQQVKL